MGRVDLNAFPKAVDNYSRIITNLKAQVDALEQAYTNLQAGIYGDEASTIELHDKTKKQVANVQALIEVLQKQINLVKEKDERYTRRLSPSNSLS